MKKYQYYAVESKFFKTYEDDGSIEIKVCPSDDEANIEVYDSDHELLMTLTFRIETLVEIRDFINYALPVGLDNPQ